MVTLFIKMFLDYRKSVIARLNELKLAKHIVINGNVHRVDVLFAV